MKTLSRVYLPLQKADLETLRSTKELPGEALAVHTVTSALITAFPTEDHESLEYTALQDAAIVSAGQGPRILIAAADVDPDLVMEGASEMDTSATIRGPLALPRVISLHLGDEGDDGSDEADIELSWYDVTEIDEVLAEL